MVENTKNASARDSLVKSFHSMLIDGAMSYYRPETVEAVARLEERFGYQDYAKELLFHKLYFENKLSVELLSRARTGYSLDQDDIDKIKRGVKRMLYSQDEMDSSLCKNFGIRMIVVNFRKYMSLKEITPH